MSIFFGEQFLRKIFITRMSYLLGINVLKSEVFIRISLERVHLLMFRNWFPVSIIFCQYDLERFLLENSSLIQSLLLKISYFLENITSKLECLIIISLDRNVSFVEVQGLFSTKTRSGVYSLYGRVQKIILTGNEISVWDLTHDPFREKLLSKVRNLLHWCQENMASWWWRSYEGIALQKYTHKFTSRTILLVQCKL